MNYYLDKKWGIILLILAVLPALGFSGGKYIEGRLGFMNPWGIGGGFRGGLLLGYQMDDVVSLNGYADYYRTSATTTVTSNTNKTPGVTATSLSSKFDANMVIGMINVRVQYPAYFFEIVKPYGQLGVGYEILVNSYAVPGAPAQVKVFAANFLTFHLDAGAQVKLGEKSYFFGNIGYNFATLQTSADPNDTLSVGTQIDGGGFSILLGIGFNI